MTNSKKQTNVHWKENQVNGSVLWPSYRFPPIESIFGFTYTNPIQFISGLRITDPSLFKLWTSANKQESQILEKLLSRNKEEYYRSVPSRLVVERILYLELAIHSKDFREALLATGNSKLISFDPDLGIESKQLGFHWLPALLTDVRDILRGKKFAIDSQWSTNDGEEHWLNSIPTLINTTKPLDISRWIMRIEQEILEHPAIVRSKM